MHPVCPKINSKRIARLDIWTTTERTNEYRQIQEDARCFEFPINNNNSGKEQAEAAADVEHETQSTSSFVLNILIIICSSSGLPCYPLSLILSLFVYLSLPLLSLFRFPSCYECSFDVLISKFNESERRYHRHTRHSCIVTIPWSKRRIKRSHSIVANSETPQTHRVCPPTQRTMPMGQ